MIDVNKLIEDHNLDKKELARAMFPENIYPGMAFKRILDGEALLDSAQVLKLAAIVGVNVLQLFNGSWETTQSPSKYVIDNGDYRAELDWKSWTTRIFHKGSMFFEEVLTKPTISLSEYVHEIGLRIAKHEFE